MRNIKTTEPSEKASRFRQFEMVRQKSLLIAQRDSEIPGGNRDQYSLGKRMVLAATYRLISSSGKPGNAIRFVNTTLSLPSSHVPCATMCA